MHAMNFSKNPACTQADAFIIQTVGIAFGSARPKAFLWIDSMPRRLCEGSMVDSEHGPKTIKYTTDYTRSYKIWSTSTSLHFLHLMYVSTSSSKWL